MANMAIKVKCNLNTCRYDGANKFSMPLQFENPVNKHLFMQLTTDSEPTPHQTGASFAEAPQAK